MHLAVLCLALVSLWPARWPYQKECGNPEVENMAWRPIDGVVEQVLDAATFRLETPNGSVRVTIANIDPSSGPAALEALRKRIEHKNAQVFTHLTEQPKETLGQVDDARGDIALAFLASGVARFVEAPAYSLSSYVECTHMVVEREAKEKHLGIWKGK